LRKASSTRFDAFNGTNKRNFIVSTTPPATNEPAASRVAGHPITVEVTVRLQAVAIPEADGGFSVAIPALRGCVTEGDTLEEVQANIVEAAEGWLASMHDRYRDEDIRVMRSALALGRERGGGDHRGGGTSGQGVGTLTGSSAGIGAAGGSKPSEARTRKTI
jgi:predicted RNase H-like HicB family nuclease